MTSRSQDFLRNTQISQINQQKINRYKLLEGQCKIQQVKLLELNILKAIFLTLLCIVTVVGLFMLIWFKWFRVKVWFSQCQLSETSHVFIKGTDGTQIQQVTHQNSGYITFYFKKLKYFMNKSAYFPASFDYQDNLKEILTHQYLSNGLTEERVLAYRNQYGMNEHSVEIPNYFSYMFHILLQPFFLIQYLVCFAYFVQGFFTFGILNLIFSIITTTINYILQYFSFKKIKQMAQRVIDVKVLRNGQFVVLKSNMLVPGDLIDPSDEIMCDCILVKGNIYVNEVSLTGQNIPIGKYALTKIQQTQENNRWLFQGSKIVEKRGATLALVVYTGYSTRRGRIIRKILTRKAKATQIYKSALIFLTEIFIISITIYFSTIAYHKSRNVSDIIVGFRFIHFLGWSFPPTFPIFFNAAYSYTIVRLKHHGIICTQPEKTVASCDLKIMCFDKTGTLTQNEVEIYQVLKFNGQNNQLDITKQLDQQQNQLISKLFGSCHTVIKSQDKFLGDQIDLRMFLLSQYQMVNSQNPDVKYQVRNKNGHALEILRINQFESKFQSMSVLVRDKSTNKIYNFIKGAPEKIMINSLIKVNNFDEIIRSLSLGGYRTIAFGFRQVQVGELQRYLQGKRQIYDQKISILGLAAFENKLKDDAKITIQRLVKSGIQPKIITGDNIYIAIETGVRAGVISKQDKVIVLEGKKQPQELIQNGVRIFRGTLISRNNNSVVQQPIQLMDGQLDVKFPIAVDNSFVKLQPPPILTPNIKLFARISPENKATIISRLKQKINQQYNKRSLITRLCGDFKDKVGMCGDGANDLMAIRQSDVGVGINNSDASYAAMFSISKLLDVQYLVRDSKATVANIVQMILYYQFITFLKIPSALLMLKDSAYWNDTQALFFNFTSTVIYPIFIPMSRPSNIITRTKPRGNLFGLLNHLQFWISCIIATAGLTGGFLYFFNSSSYIPNPRPIVDKGWQRQTHAGTCVLLMILMPFSFYMLTFYIGYPWKRPVYRNYILFILIIINTIVSIVINYVQDKLAKVLGFVPIPLNIVSILLGISIGVTILGFIYNKIITKIFNPTDHQMQQILDDQQNKVIPK